MDANAYVAFTTVVHPAQCSWSVQQTDQQALILLLNGNAAGSVPGLFVALHCVILKLRCCEHNHWLGSCFFLFSLS